MPNNNSNSVGGYKGSVLHVIGPYDYDVKDAKGNSVGTVTARDREHAKEKVANGDFNKKNDEK